MADTQKPQIQELPPAQPDALQELIANEVRKNLTEPLKEAVSYSVNKSVGASLAAASGALRQRSYEFNPITPREFLVKPEPIRSPEIAPTVGLVLTKRFMYMPGCHLLAVMYEENNKYKASLTTFNEEALGSIRIVNLHPALQEELVRQIAEVKPLEAGQVAYFGVYISENMFGVEPEHHHHHAQEAHGRADVVEKVQEQEQAPAAQAAPAQASINKVRRPGRGGLPQPR